MRTYHTQGWTKKSGCVCTSSTEILICGINITANIFLNNVLKFVNTYIQLIKHQFKVRKCRLSNQHHRKLNKNYFMKLNCSLHVHYNIIIKFTLYMHLQSCGRTLWNNNTCAIQHINSRSRTVWILIDSCGYEVMDNTTLTTSCPQSHNCSWYLCIPNMQNFLISIFYWLKNKSDKYVSMDTILCTIMKQT